jgi:hypothetical protein
MSFPLPIHHSRLPGPPAILVYPSNPVVSHCFQMEKDGQLEMRAQVDPQSQIAKPPSGLK